MLVEGWHRITSGAGDRMPTDCPVGGFRCNTNQPIYLSKDGLASGEDVYPALGITVTRTAYASSYNGNCKQKSYTIKIKNCGGYFVYYLVPISGGCSSAYCFGNQLPCGEGTRSESGFTPGCATYPNVTVSPYVKVSLYETTEMPSTVEMVYSRASFECHAEDLVDSYTYTVRWYVNDIEMKGAKIEGLSKSKLQAGDGRMLENHWTSVFKPNMLVRCAMQIGGNGYGTSGPQIYSENYFAGIKLDRTSDYVVAEGEELHISAQLTMPLSCSWPANNPTLENTLKNFDCTLVLLTGIPSYQNDVNNCQGGIISKDGVVFVAESCGIKFSHANWTAKQTITIKGQTDQLVNINDRIVFLRLYNSDRVEPMDDLKYWKNIHLPDIKIYVKDRDVVTLGTSCYSNNDPHMRTFDGRTWELQGRNDLTEGEYILYQHDRLPLQINAYFKKCSDGTILCNCGIAVRSAESIFVANYCDTIYYGERKVNRYMIQRLCDDQSLIIEKTSTSYTITLPTGTKVTFVYAGSWINGISIVPSILDANLTKGLCGIYNNDQKDDFLLRAGLKVVQKEKEFAESWKVGNAFREGTLFDPDGKLKQTEYFGQQYCSCVSQSRTFPHGSPTYNCNLTTPMAVCRRSKTTEGPYTASCTTRAKRSATDEYEKEDEQPPSFPLIADVSPPAIIAEKWRNGWTEESAQKHCTDKFISAPAYNVCMDFVPQLDSTQYILDCIADIKSTGGDDWLKATIRNYASACLQEASKMEILTVTNSTNSTGSEKPVLSIIKETTCPDNCSGNGLCSEGECHCFPGFYGELCSVVLSQAPYVEKNAFEGLCDTNKKSCKTFVIPGSDFAKESSLMCKFTSFLLKLNGTRTTIVDDETFTHSGTYSSSFLMYCKLPKSRKRRSIEFDVIAIGYRISVSNNGENYSEPLTTLVYDSLCYECNISSMLCKQKDACYSKSTGAKEGSNKILWLGIGVGVVSGIIIIVVVGMCVCKRHIKQRSYIKDSTLSLPNSSKQMSPLAHFDNKEMFRSKPNVCKSDLAAYYHDY